MRFLLLALLLTACPPSSNTAAPDATVAPLEACKKVGQSCEYSPGKLGSCVARDGCTDPATGAACFVCQSQH